MPIRGTLSVSKAQKLIKFKSKWPLEKGYLKYIDWYKEFLKFNLVIKVSILFNGLRGLKVLNYLKHKKDIKIKNIFLAKKFLNFDVYEKLKKKYKIL